jgi:hypothetical protein
MSKLIVLTDEITPWRFVVASTNPLQVGRFRQVLIIHIRKRSFR